MATCHLHVFVLCCHNVEHVSPDFSSTTTMAAKESGFDLMNPPESSHPPPLKISPAVQQKCEACLIKESWLKVLNLLKLVHCELLLHLEKRPSKFNMQVYTIGDHNIMGLIKTCIKQLAAGSWLTKLDKKNTKKDTLTVSPQTFHIFAISLWMYITTSKSNQGFSCQPPIYSCPSKYHEGWKTLIDQHYTAGQIRLSSSQYTPSFIIPKIDPTILPCWVNDYHNLNCATISDNYPLPQIDDILANCVKGKIWGKINMTNSFFQTLVHPNHIKYTATLTPFGLWEWVVMPMGLQNSPATYQHYVTMTLKDLIGQICHVYLDNIIIWSQTLAKHKYNVSLVLEALNKAQLYWSPKKLSLFNTELNFLGHTISQRGIKADDSKVCHILNWPTPTSAKKVQCFLGLVQYISTFLPALAEHTALLTPLTQKECNTIFPAWTSEHHHVLESIKALVVLWDCLTMIDHHNPGKNKIFVTWCFTMMHQHGPVLWTHMGNCQAGGLRELSTSWCQTALPCPWTRDAFDYMGPQEVVMWPAQFKIHYLHRPPNTP